MHSGPNGADVGEGERAAEAREALARGDASAALLALSDVDLGALAAQGDPHGIVGLTARTLWRAGSVARVAATLDHLAEGPERALYTAWVALTRGDRGRARAALDQTDGAPDWIVGEAAVIASALAGPAEAEGVLVAARAGLRDAAALARVDVARAALAFTRGRVGDAETLLDGIVGESARAELLRARIATLRGDGNAVYDGLAAAAAEVGRLGRAGLLARYHLAMADAARRADFRVTHVEHAQGLLAALGDRRGEVVADAQGALVELELGELEEAELAATQAIEEADALGIVGAGVAARVVLGVTWTRREREDEGRVLLVEAAGRAEAAGLLPWRLHALAGLERADEVAAEAGAAGLPGDAWGVG